MTLMKYQTKKKMMKQKKKMIREKKRKIISNNRYPDAWKSI